MIDIESPRGRGFISSPLVRCAMRLSLTWLTLRCHGHHERVGRGVRECDGGYCSRCYKELPAPKSVLPSESRAEMFARATQKGKR